MQRDRRQGAAKKSTAADAAMEAPRSKRTATRATAEEESRKGIPCVKGYLGGMPSAEKFQKRDTFSCRSPQLQQQQHSTMHQRKGTGSSCKGHDQWDELKPCMRRQHDQALGVTMHRFKQFTNSKYVYRIDQ